MAPSSKKPDIAKVQVILGNYSIASVRTWLKSKKLPYTANSRADLAKRVHGLIDQDKVSLDEVIDGLIGIEEAASKVVHVLTFDVAEQTGAAIDKQLADVGTPLSDQRAPAAGVTKTPKLIYAINSADQLRAKWAESQTKVVAHRRDETFTRETLPRLIVLKLAKKQGVAEIRYDKPLDIHTHTVDGNVRAEAYFDFYREKAENMTGLGPVPADLRAGLRSVLLEEPPVVVPVTVDHIAEDGGTNRTGHRKKGGDPRTTADWKRMHSGPGVRTYEAAPLRWLPPQTKGKLTREVISVVDAVSGTVRFDADCHEDEIEYVLARLLQKH